jgi:type IV pilus assembly protein PilW
MPLTHRAERGLSIVEMMVGIAVGLFVVAGASLLVSTLLGENRRLLLDTQLQQDLRASADIIAHEVRRAGAQSETLAVAGVWSASSPASSPLANGFAATVASSASEVDFSYLRDSGMQGPYGFRLQGGAIQTQLAFSGWQELTDPSVLTVTGFTVTETDSSAQKLPCTKPCPTGGATSCWPTVIVRQIAIAITASSVADPTITRSLRTAVRLRNDWVPFAAPNPPGGAAWVCPQ